MCAFSALRQCVLPASSFPTLPLAPPLTRPSRTSGSPPHPRAPAARSTALAVLATAAAVSAQDCYMNFGNSSFNLLPYQGQP
jgi:hypothetical protein